jgi:hypothetical protein
VDVVAEFDQFRGEWDDGGLSVTWPGKSYAHNGILSERADHTAGISGSYAIGWNILRYHARAPYDGILPNPDSFQHIAACSQKYVAFDNDGGMCGLSDRCEPPSGGYDGMKVRVSDCYIGANQTFIADLDGSDSADGSPAHPHVITNSDAGR